MGKKNTFVEMGLNENLKMNIKELNSLETFINKAMEQTDFSQLNKLIKEDELAICINLEKTTGEFVSLDRENIQPYANTISEKEFYKIIGYRNNKLSKRSGHYQEILLEKYLEAKKENDFGYIQDILTKAMSLENNINYAKFISKNKRFIREWKDNITDCTPLDEVKNTGSIKKINTIRNRID